MNIETQMRALRLHGMERNWKALNETRRNTELTLSEGLALLLQAEADERDEKRFNRLKQNAGFRYQASIEEINMAATRGLDKGNAHPYSWTAIINGMFSRKELDQAGFPAVSDYLEANQDTLGISGAMVTHIYCDDVAAA